MRLWLIDVRAGLPAVAEALDREEPPVVLAALVEPFVRTSEALLTYVERGTGWPARN